jgi:hypothetical protein
MPTKNIISGNPNANLCSLEIVQLFESGRDGRIRHHGLRRGPRQLPKKVAPMQKSLDISRNCFINKIKFGWRTRKEGISGPTHGHSAGNFREFELKDRER